MDTKEFLQNKERNEIGRLINFRPVFTFALFLILGILSSYIRIVEEKSSVWIVLVLLAVAALFLALSQEKFRCAVFVTVFGVAFLAGSLSFAWTVDNYRSQPKYSGVYSVVGTVTEKTVAGGGGEIFLTDLTVDGIPQSGGMSVRLRDSDFAALQYCDRVAMRLTVRPANYLDWNYGFRAEAVADNRLYTGSQVEYYSVVGTQFRLGTFLRGKIQVTLQSALSEESAALVAGILLGDTTSMDEDLLENIRYGGIAHIFAVSGLHIGCMFAACLMIFRRDRVPAPIQFAITLTVLLFYGSICGYSASVVRATVTCMVMYACKLLGLKGDSLESLSLAAVIVFLVYPTLLFGVGAQLSFSACLGILLLATEIEKGLAGIVDSVGNCIRYKLLGYPQPPARDMFRRNTSPEPLARQWSKKVVSFLSISLSAQIATAPILYLAFGYFSALSILLNCIFVPIVSACFAPLLILTAIAAILPKVVGAALLYPVGVIASSLLLPFHLVRLSAGVVRSLTVTPSAVIAYYVAVLFASDKFNLPKWQRKVTMIGFFLVFLTCLAVAS